MGAVRADATQPERLMVPVIRQLVLVIVYRALEDRLAIDAFLDFMDFLHPDVEVHRGTNKYPISDLNFIPP